MLLPKVVSIAIVIVYKLRRFVRQLIVGLVPVAWVCTAVVRRCEGVHYLLLSYTGALTVCMPYLGRSTGAFSSYAKELNL